MKIILIIFILSGISLMIFGICTLYNFNINILAIFLIISKIIFIISLGIIIFDD